MDKEEIKWVQNLYVEAAKRAVQAGFDIAYIYGSHAVMPMQFLSKFYNKREDEYGGSLENRARFWIECLGLLKEHVGDECAIACRISVDQMMGSDGIQASEDPVQFAELAEKEGVVDIWDVNVCDFMEWGEDAGPSRFYKANHQAPFTKFIRAATKQPLLNVGRLTSPDDMADIITSGQADIIGGARPSIADPFLPKKIEEGRNEDIRECIGCNICIQALGAGGAAGLHPERGLERGIPARLASGKGDQGGQSRLGAGRGRGARGPRMRPHPGRARLRRSFAR